MRLKMFSLEDAVIIETNDVTSFGPDFANGGNFTKIETQSPDGDYSEIVVKHDFYQVTAALATAWDMDRKKAEVMQGGNHA